MSGPTLRDSTLNMGPTKQDFEALLDWWRLAGVTHAFADGPSAWLGEGSSLSLVERAEPATEPQSPRGPAPAAKPPAGAVEKAHVPAMPGEIGAFTEWFVSQNPLLLKENYPALAATGPNNAELMILAEAPEQTDRTRLLEGQMGEFLDQMLRAMGLERAAVYCATVLPQYQSLPDWPALDQSGAALIARHHIELASPKRLVIFSRAVSRMLLPAEQGPVGAFAQTTFESQSDDARAMRAMAVPSLDELLQSAAHRRRFWRAWLDWTRE